MKKFICTLAIASFLSQISCAQAPLVELETTVTDEAGEPIEAVNVFAYFRGPTPDKSITAEAETDEEGFAILTGNAFRKATMRLTKSGYYESRHNDISVYEPNVLPRTRELAFTLREQRNPIALYAKRADADHLAYKLPVKGEWVGFDLEAGDWIDPHGDGERSDVLFRYTNEFLGLNISEKNLARARELNSTGPIPWTEERERHTHGDWSGTLEISFPREREGILAVDESNGYVAYSAMRLPHLAPEEGYEESIRWSNVRTGQIVPRKGEGYFLRVRVRERNDQILEANYAKINDEIRFDPRGTIYFNYYFNPEVNDRNLEFDPKQNLFADSVEGSNVIVP